MAEIDGGALSFKSVMDNDQINTAIEETLRRVQGLSDGTVAGGKKMDMVFDETAEKIRSALAQIGQACETHEQALAQLEAEYKRLGEQASNAFESGRDGEYAAIKEQQAAIEGEIKTRQQLLQELRDGSSALEEEAGKIESNRQKVEENAAMHDTMRSRIRALKEEMMQLADQGIDQNSARYKALVDELGRLQDIQGDVAAQGKTLANDEQKFQGVISGLSGLAGGFSAVTGAVSLFAGENENLNKIMTKVQSVMAITIGIQQVAETLNKDSAFSLVTINGLKKWWADIVAQSAVAETAETIATNANTAAHDAQAAATAKNTVAEVVNTTATGAQATAATAGTAANIGLAGAFRLVGTAIKSIPVFGWILAGISALIGLYSYFASKAHEAQKAQEEFSKAMIEGCYKPIGTIEELSAKYAELGNDMKAKEKFIQDNKKAFDDLGVAVSSVRDAENLLVANKDRFILAQIAKAKAMVYTQQSAESIKKLMKLQAEYDAMPDTKKTYVQTSSGMYGGTSGNYVSGENTDKKNKKKEIEDLTAEIKNGYRNAFIEEKNAAYNLKKGGIGAVNDYSAGTVGAIEQAISRKQDALKKLKPNSKEWKQAYADIAKLQKQIAAPSTGGTTRNTGGSSSDKDPFLTKLESYKKEYDRFKEWVNSGDSVLAKAAATEFKGLLAQGSSYIDFLKKQRDIILGVDISNRTKAQNAQLRTLNDQIAEETKKTVLDAFNEELSNSLTNAKTTVEMLNIIAQKRKELANDGTDIDNSKKESLDNADKNAIEKQKTEIDKLLEEYSSFLDKKLLLEKQYTDDIALLEKRRSEATTDADKSKIDQAIANRTKKYNKDSKGSGDTDYDAMVQQYANFEQKKQSIIDEYDEKRKTAQEHGNTQLVEELNKAQAKALSGLAATEMKDNPNFEKIFGNLDEISTKKLEQLLQLIDGQTAFLGIKFDPKDLEAIKDKIESIKNEIRERNPFKALASSIKDYSKATDAESKKKALTNMFQSASSACSLVSGGIAAISGGLQKMGMDADSEAAAILNDLGGIADGASQVMQGIASGNPLSVIQGGIGMLTSAFDLFNSKDRKAERSIKKHQEQIKVLENAYKQLEWQIDKALGSAVYQNQQAAIANMKQQQVELLGMISDEESKKKTDSGKIKEWQEQIAELDRNIQDAIDKISKDILQTDAKTFADELGDALVEAFGKGEDAADSFGETVNKVLKEAVLNQLKKRFLETQLQGALDALEKSMGYWSGDNFVFDGLTEAEIASFKDKVAAITGNFNQALGIYSDLFKDISTTENDTSLTGVAKGVSEETASLIGGQMNAVRINQIEATAILRQQLMHLATIAQNTSYNVHLLDIRNDIRDIKNGSSGNSLRSQGLS